MASSFTHCSFHCHTQLSTNVTISSSFLPTSFSGSIFCGNTGFSLRRTSLNLRTCAKFEKFQGESSEDKIEADTSSPLLENLETNQEGEGEDEDDSCLPSDLADAVRQSGQASALFFSSGGMRAIVELLIPQLQYLDDEGAQVELWELSRIYLETLIEETGCQNVKAIFPDAGAAALLKHRWGDATFRFASLSDRRPVENDDEIVVMVVPDHQMLSYVEKIAANLSVDPPRPLIMWNPRLISGDVGVGVNVRKLRRYFLSTFTPVYSMRPLTSGAVFRCYPGLWKVFYDDKDRPGRYLLAKEFITRPNTEDLEFVFGETEQKSEDKRNFFDKATGVFSSINRFMKAM